MADASNTNRRAVLKGIPAAMAGMTASPALAGEDATPILRLFHQRQAILGDARVHICAASGSDEDAEFERLFYRRCDRIEDEMMAMPCTCAADFAAKFIVATCDGGALPERDNAIWQEAHILTGASA